MRIRFLTAATLAVTALLLPNLSQAQSSRPPRVRSEAAYLMVDRLVAHREALALTEHQVHDLTTLSHRLRHPRVVGFDGAPGKAVPRIERARPTPDDARRLALRHLNPEQRRQAVAILDPPEPAQTAGR